MKSYLPWIAILTINVALASETVVLYHRVNRDESDIASDRTLFLNLSKEQSANLNNQTDHQWNAMAKSSDIAIDTAQKLVDAEHDYADKMFAHVEQEIADATKVAEKARMDTSLNAFALSQASQQNQLNAAQLSSSLSQIATATQDAAQAAKDANLYKSTDFPPLTPAIQTITVTPIGGVPKTFIVDPN